MSATAIIGLAGGVVLLILFLLWRLEVAKRKKIEIEKAIAEKTTGALREQVLLERELHEAAKIDRPAIEAKIKALEERLDKLKPGDTIEDAFGAGDKSEGDGE